MTQEYSVLPENMNSEYKDILQLFHRPFDGGQSINETPISFPVAPDVEVATRGSFPAPSLPDIGSAASIPKGSVFSHFVRSHRRAAKDLCNVFMKTNSARELQQVAKALQGRVNEALFIYCLTFVIIRKPELRGMRLPTVVEVFPNRFVQQEMIMQAQSQVNRMPPGQEAVIIDQEFSGTLLKPEHRVSYWREDYGMNVHHWHWHLVNPVELEVNRDRKGELFFYMHQQMLARYDMERQSVGLNRVLPLNNLRVPIEDGYFPKLTVNNAGRVWGTRQDNTLLRDLTRDDFGFGAITLTEMEIWYGRILDAVHQGFLIDRNGDRVPLSDDVTKGKRGIDLLGDAFEADAEMSINYPFYGDVHNFGHVLLSLAHDPDFSHKEEPGVMAETATAMRDPVFYRWHKFIDNLFQEYKIQQRPYEIDDLNLEGVKIERAGVTQGNATNELRTGWNTREFEAGRGLDFNSPVPVKLRFTHLDHKPFDYIIQITNNLSRSKEVTVRIYLAPMYDIRGTTMDFAEQRILWAEMDKFVVSLKPGLNQLVRSSKESSITSPEELTFRELETGRTIVPGTDDAAEFSSCGCGWPQHLLLPRGTPQGMDYQLFFLISDWEKDKVEQPKPNRVCSNAASFCGILDSKFPDKRPMGFPFDRTNPPTIFNKTINTAGDFAGQFENMTIQNIKITFTDAMME